MKTKKGLSRIIASLFCLMTVVAGCLFAPMATKAATPTPENAVIFTVRGAVSGGNLQYEIIVDGVYNQTYQSFTITYPAELDINYPVGLGTVWNITSSTGAGTKTTTFIIKTGSSSATNLKLDLEKISFTLATPDIFPAEGSKVSISAFPTKVTQFVDNNGYVHYYEYIKGAVNWLEAYNAAHNRTMQDPRFPDDPSKKLYGYLATITSQAEQRKVYNDIATECGWLGGTRMTFGTGPASPYTASANKKIQDDGSKNIGSTATSNIPTTISTTNYNTAATQWYWADGPEAWTVYNSVTGKYVYYPFGMTIVPSDSWVISDGAGNYTYAGTGATAPIIANLPAGYSVVIDPNRGVAVTPLVFYNKITHAAEPAGNGAPLGVYANWNNPYGVNVDGTAGTGGEPNNSSTEFVVQFAYTGKDLWNDYANTPGTNVVLGYYVEYGGYPGDPKADELGGSNVTTTSEVELVMPIIIQYRSTVQNPDNTYRQITGIGTSKDRDIIYETHLPFTAYRETEITVNDMFTPPAGYTAYGYKFYGSTEDENNLTINEYGDINGFHSNATQRIVFLYKPDNVMVTFDPNFPGSSSANVSPGSKTVQFDSPYGTLATAIRPGYTLDGWYTSASGGTKIEPTSIVGAASGTDTDHTLYAHWSVKNNYSVEYDLNGGTGDDTPKTGVAWTQTNLLPPSAPTRTGYTFTGWNVSYNGDKQGVTNGDEYGQIANNDADDHIVLQAQWILENEVHVIYHTNGGTPSTISDDVLANSSVSVVFPAISRTGYTFDGWKVTNKGNGTSGSTYAAGTSGVTFSGISATSASFIILEAQWTAKTYTVNYDENYGSVPAPYGTSKTGVTWSQNGLVPPDVVGNPTRFGYIFMGWNTQTNGLGTTAYVGSTYSQLVLGDTQLEVTLYAQWQEERNFSVKYDINGGTPSTIPDKTGVYLADDQLLPRDTSNIPITVTPPPGYTFSGWSVSYNGSKTGVDDSDTFGDLAADPNAGFIILQAQYSPKHTYTVNYDTQGGTPTYITPKTSVVWTQISLLPPTDPSRSGYNFLGWYTATSGGGIKASTASSYSDLVGGVDISSVTLYAHWAEIVPNQYVVRYNSNGGSAVSDQVFTTDPTTTIVQATAPTPPVGYKFAYWYVENNGNEQGTTNSPDGTTTKYSELAYKYAAGDPRGAYANFIVLKAYYTEINTFEVEYDWNYPGAPYTGSSPDVLTGVRWTQSGFTPYSWDDSGTPKPAYRSGYNLLGWTTNNDGSGVLVISSTQYKTLTSGIDTVTSVMLYAQWELATFKVSYDLNGGTPPTGTESEYATITVGFYDIGLIPPSFDRPGYELTGWNVSENGSKLNVSSSDSYGDLANSGAQYITLQAQWTARDYTVKYDLDGGHVSTPPYDITIADKTTIKWYASGLLPAETLERMGYTFGGWQLYKIGGTEITGGATVSTQRYQDLAEQQETDNGSITLRAIWNAKTGYTVNYNLDGGYYNNFNTADSQTGVNWTTDYLLPYGTSYDSTKVTRAGYTFTGWYVSVGGSGTGITGVLTYGELATDDLTISITFQAQWTEKNNVTINYETLTQYSDESTRTENDGGGVSSPSESLAPATGTAAGSTAAANAGYTFMGWFKEDNGTLGAQVGSVASFTPGKTAYDDGNAYETATYIAVFKENANITITYGTKSFSNSWSPQADSLGGSVSPNGAQPYAPATGSPSSTATAKAGYTFIGWFVLGADYENDTPLATTLAFNPAKVSDLNVAATYIAVFKENTNITITYGTKSFSNSWSPQADSLGGSVSPNGAQPYAPATGSPSSTATAKAGYTFIGWFVLGADYENDTPLATTLAFNPAKVSDLNVAATYIAVFKENLVAITLDKNAADATDGSVTSIFGKAYGGTIDSALPGVTPAIPTRTGYTFIGWSKTSGSSNTVDFTADTILTAINGVDITTTPYTLTLYAVWAANQYTINYNANGGSGLMPYDTAFYGYNVSLSPNTFTRTGYTFTGWNTLANGNGAAYADGYTFTPWDIDGSLTLYAQWQQNSTPATTYTVTYNGNGNTGGTAPTDSNSYSSGATVTVLGNTGNLIKTNYTFLGWSTSASATSATYTAGSTFVISSNVTLYAVWQSTVAPPDVEYRVYVEDSYADISGAGTYTPGVTVSINAGTREGYIFVGWTVVSGGVTLANSGSAVTTFTMPGNDVTVKANWKKIDDTTPSINRVYVEDSYANPTGAGSYDLGAKVSIDAGTREGYTFKGWTVVSGGVTLANSGSAVTTFTMPGNDVTVKANWEKDSTTPVTPREQKTGSKWALVNLILAVVGGIAALFTLVKVFLRKRKDTEENNNTKGSREYKETKKTTNLIWLFITIIAGIAGVIVFICTENMNNPMTMVDWWTILNAILLVIGCAGAMFTFTRKSDTKSSYK